MLRNQSMAEQQDVFAVSTITKDNVSCGSDLDNIAHSSIIRCQFKIKPENVPALFFNLNVLLHSFYKFSPKEAHRRFSKKHGWNYTN